MNRLHRIGLLVLIVSVTAPSFAQDPPASATPPAAPSAAPAAQPAPAQTGRPVAESQPPQQQPRRAARPRRPGKQEAIGVPGGPAATYPGFRMMPDGTSRIWLEVSNKVPVTEHKAPGRVTYSLRGASAPVRTNRLPLITGWFASPATRVQLVPQSDGVDLVIELRTPSEATHKVTETREGMLLQVDLPKLPQTNKDTGEPTTTRDRSKRSQTTKSIGGGRTDDPGF